MTALGRQWIKDGVILNPESVESGLMTTWREFSGSALIWKRSGAGGGAPEKVFVNDTPKSWRSNLYCILMISGDYRETHLVFILQIQKMTVPKVKRITTQVR